MKTKLIKTYVGFILNIHYSIIHFRQKSRLKNLYLKKINFYELSHKNVIGVGEQFICVFVRSKFSIFSFVRSKFSIFSFVRSKFSVFSLIWSKFSIFSFVRTKFSIFPLFDLQRFPPNLWKSDTTLDFLTFEKCRLQSKFENVSLFFVSQLHFFVYLNK
jgi:hypothetical protein